MRQSGLIFVMCLFLLACSNAPAPEPAGSVEMQARPEIACPEGVEVFPRWQGEYPAPVIHVREPVDLPAYVDPCDTEPANRCTLQPGVYHPWGEGEAFVTVRPIEPFHAREPFSLEDTEVQAGEAVEILGYLGEGYCTWRVRGEEIAADCSDVRAYPLEPLPAVDYPERQFMRTECEGWLLVDDELLERPEIVNGTIPEYGRVGPAGS